MSAIPTVKVEKENEMLIVNEDDLPHYEKMGWKKMEEKPVEETEEIEKTEKIAATEGVEVVEIPVEVTGEIAQTFENPISDEAEPAFSHYTKEQLKSLAEVNELEIKSSMSKGEIFDLLLSSNLKYETLPLGS